MSEFLLELYSEEIPPQLQINARTQLKQQLENSFKEDKILVFISSEALLVNVSANILL